MSFKTTSKKPEFAMMMDEVRYTKVKKIFEWKSRCHWDALCELMAVAYEEGYKIGALKANGPEEVETWKEEGVEERA